MNYTLKTCEEEYAKDERISRADIAELMEWVSDQPHMPNVKEFMLIQCYQVSDYDLHKAKTLVEALYQFKHKAPELFTGRDYEPPKYNHTFFDICYFLLLPTTTADGCRLLYLSIKDCDSSKFDHDISAIMQVKVLFTIMMEQGSSPGYVMIVDVGGFKFGHLRSFSLSITTKLLHFIQEAIPIKVKGIHLINMHMIARSVLALVRPFTSQEIWNMIHLHDGIENVYNIVPKEKLPKDLGGALSETMDDLNEMNRCRVNALNDAVNEELQLRTHKSKAD